MFILVRTAPLNYAPIQAYITKIPTRSPYIHLFKSLNDDYFFTDSFVHSAIYSDKMWGVEAQIYIPQITDTAFYSHFTSLNQCSV